MATFLITGAGGLLGSALAAELVPHGRVLALTRDDLDVTDARAVRERIGDERPDVVLQCAAYVDTERAEREPERALAVNGAATANVATACDDVGALLVYPSSDYVFDGRAERPYSPEAPTGPVNAYGRSKVAGEAAARRAARWLVVRTSWVFGPGGRNFVRTILDAARAGRALRVVDDQRGAPTYSPDLAAAIRRLIDDAPPNRTWHATNAGSATWHELALAACAAAELETPIARASSAEYGGAPRPAYSLLDCSATDELIGPMRPWRVALEDAIRTGRY